MLSDVLNVANTTLPVARIGCYATASFLVGRKATQALSGVSLQLGSKVAEYLEKPQMAKNFKAAGNRYLEIVQKDLIKDLKKAAKYMVAGFCFERAENKVFLIIANRNADEAYASVAHQILENSWNAVSGAASKTYSLVFGDQRYPLDRLAAYLYVNFRLTAPAYVPWYRNFGGTCGPVCQQNVVEFKNTQVYPFFIHGRNVVSSAANKTIEVTKPYVKEMIKIVRSSAVTEKATVFVKKHPTETFSTGLTAFVLRKPILKAARIALNLSLNAIIFPISLGRRVLHR